MAAIISADSVRELDALLSSGNLNERQERALKQALHVIKDRRDERVKHPWEMMGRAAINKSRAKKAGKL